ncbi:hypothetical protein P3T35_007560 [Kitasatospora sp. GP30]|uniref:hypothetical protein n=1 Tax=Kitasatospora sp. GP30 TaxID=3035084 RepID=UPI000C6FD439|nr:hypothetical protein [Kitasatospora sp. GP30]MDH6145505.1 hypothetical protein [Kitasatospora sp. GP30]
MNSPISEALLLRATATTLDAHRAKLPQVSGPFRLPDPIGVAGQITELGRSITEMGDEYLFRAGAPAPQEHTAHTAEALASAIGSVAQAASALGTVAQQIAFVARTAGKRDDVGYEDAHTVAGQMIEFAVETANDDLAEAAQTLRTAASAVSPPAVQLQRAALARSPGATATAPAPTATAAPATAAVQRAPARSR